MKPLSLRTACSLLSSALLSSLLLGGSQVGAQLGFLSKMVDGAVDRVTSYALKAKVIEYATETDFDPAGNVVTVVELSPGQSIRYSCGKAGVAARGKFMLAPADPSAQVLAAKGEDPMEVAVTRVQPSYNVYRSDRALFIKTFQKLGFDHMLIDYHSDTTLMARDPENFSVNLLCIYIPSASEEAPRYRWLQIKFKGVLPMAYGCGSTKHHMFKNTIPKPRYALSATYRSPERCKIYAQPGMVVGIYCDKNDHVSPPHCFRQVANQKGNMSAYNRIQDRNFHYSSSNDRLRLMKIAAGVDAADFSFECYCKDAEDRTTAVVKVALRNPSTCDLVQILSDYRLTGKFPWAGCYKEISAGKSVSIVMPRPTTTVNPRATVGGLHMYPKEGIDTAYFTAMPATELKRTKIHDMIGLIGFSATQREYKDKLVYNFSAAKDAVIVIKHQVASLSYLYKYYDTFKGSPSTDMTAVSLGFLPTDPYTYGCGVGNTSIFNQQGVRFRNEPIKRGSNHYTQVNCTVNVWESSPVGFYCPKDHILVPHGCFSKMYLRENEKVVNLTDYAPTARIVDAPNLKVVDFLVPESTRDRITYSKEELQCLCRRKDGTLMATITLQLSKPSNK
ncbi:6-cysteine protein [Babesia caballi]|uniref:6-cysteine protein n=1 Tax=Babesia caballi TaxID=5871 RepID=A0AAV4LTV9_BABCB|nr:6-cysteine protein [Babesia caballi]